MKAKRVTHKLIVLSLVASFATPTFAASPARSTRTIWGRIAERFGLGREADPRDHQINITVHEGSAGDDRVPADGQRKIFRADETILKEVHAVEYTPDYLAGKPGNIGRGEKVAAVGIKIFEAAKPTALVTGEAGVGKTSLVRQVARMLHAVWRLIPGMGPVKFFEIDINAIVAGTTYRGELEDKFKALLEYMKKLSLEDAVDANGKVIIHPLTRKPVKNTVIIYLDEMHQIMSSGRTSDSSTGLADLLKPYLSDENLIGRVKVIGSTTRREAKVFDQDQAVKRRLGGYIDLEAPENKEAVNMIKGVRERYESHYGIRFPDSAIEAWVTAAARYSEFVLPDPALDMLHKAGARALVEGAISEKDELFKARLARLLSERESAVNAGTAASRTEVHRLDYQIHRLKKEILESQAQRMADQPERMRLIASSNHVRAIEAEIKMLQDEVAQAVVNTVDATDMVARKANEQIHERIRVLGTELERAQVQHAEVYQRSREHLPELGVREALEAAAAVTQQPVEVLGRTLQDWTPVLTEQLPRQVEGQRSSLARIGEVLLPKMGIPTLVNKAKATITLVKHDLTDQSEDMIKAVDQLAFGANNDAVDLLKKRTLILDFSHGHNDLYETVLAAVNDRSQRAIGLLNIQEADPMTLHLILTLITDGKIQIGTKVKSLENVILVPHLGGHLNDTKAKVLSENARNEAEVKMKLAEMYGVATENLLKPEQAARIPYLTAILQQSDAVVALNRPSVHEMWRIVYARLGRLNELFRQEIQGLSHPIEIRLGRREAHQLARAAGGNIGTIDRALDELVKKLVGPGLRTGEIRGGDVVNLRVRQLPDDSFEWTAVVQRVPR